VTTEQDPATPDKRELLDAFDKVVNRERERAVERVSLPTARRTPVVVAALGVLAWVALAYVWLAQPAWLFSAGAVSERTAAEQESDLRFGLYLSRERVLDFWEEHRRLPATLAEAGDVEAGVEYTVSGDSTFAVSVLLGDSLHTLNESQSALPLLEPTGIRPTPRRPRQ
jgi:hypothetical protein